MKQALVLLLAVGLAVASAPQAFAATIETDTTYYAPGDTVAITGTGYSAFETITIEVTSILGLGPEDTWDVTADATGTVETSYYLSAELDVPDTMAIGVSSETPQDLSGTSVVLGLKTYLHQLHNGTSTASPGWALGNINSSNSCYSESRSVPFRYFVKGTLGDSEHFFTIQCEWTKNGLHAYDYFTDVDLSEADAIFDAGGLCGTDFADPPPGCVTPTGSFAFPDPTNTSNYSGSLPGDFFPSGFAVAGPRNMKFFNASVDSVSDYFFTGSAPNYELNIIVYFTTENTGTVGMFWGGHLAAGTPDTWGIGNGSGSIGGASYHMRALALDGGGGAGKDRSIQNITLCLPPDATITCESDSACTGSTYSCSVPTGASSYDWTVSGATINSGQGTNSITYTVTALTGESVLVGIVACDSTSGCPGDNCCNESSEEIPVGNCCDPPVATCPGDTTLFVCDLSEICLPGFDCTHSATVTDGYLNGNSVCFTPVEGVNNISLICTNECNDSDTCEVQVTVVLNTAPVCTLPPDDSFFVCGDSTFSFPVSATDADNNLVGCTKISGPGDFDGANWTFTTDGPGVYSATFECTDECDTSCGGSTNITVTYNTPPVCIAPNDTTFFVGGDTTLSFTVSASDIDDNLVGCTMLSGPGTFDGTTWTFTTTAPGVYTAEFECLDECGASAFGGRGGFVNITVLYNSPPVCDIPPDDTFFVCDDTTFTFVVSATDIDDNLVGCTMLSGPGTFDGSNWSFTSTGTGVYTAEFECEDAYGETCGGTTNITVNYNSSPVCTVPNDTTIFQCSPAQVSLPVTATDVDDNLVGCSLISGPGSIVGGYWVYTPSASGPVNVTVRCTDECGAYCEGSFTVTFEMDSEAPTITCPSAVSVQCAGDVPPPDIGSVTVSDNCDPSPVVIHVSDVSDGNTCPEVITRTYRATDASANSAECTQTITIDDTIDPVITCPADLTVDCNGSTDPSSTGSATATDNCTASPAITYVDVQTGNVITRTWTAADDCNNTDVCVQTITITDTTDPIVTCPTAVSVQCPGDVPPPDIGSVTVSDDCDPNPVVIHLGDVSDGNTCPEIITRTYRATDASGNFAECTQTITIDDTIDPVITCPADLTVDCNASTDPSNTGTATATDVCDPNPTVSYSDVVDMSGCGGYTGTITRTWVGTDACNNSGSCVQIITVIDTVDPVVTCPADATIQCHESTDPSNTGSATATDNCDPNPAMTYTDVVDMSGCGGYTGTITRTWVGTDACNNSGSCVQIITIIDTVDPVVDCPEDVQVACDDPTDPSSTGTANATDNCTSIGNIVIDYTDIQVGHVLTRTWTATDLCGNSSQCDQEILIGDGLPPVCNVPNDTTIFQCVPEQVSLPVSGTNNAVCEVVDGPGEVVDGYWVYAPTDDETVNVTIRCTDACDLYCEASFEVIFDINEAPVCFVPNDTTIFQCAPTQVFLPAWAEDVDGNLDSCTIDFGPGGYEDGYWYYTPSGDDDTVDITILCLDQCGASCTKTFTVIFEINDPPECGQLLTLDRFVCDDTTFNISIPPATDPDGNLVECSMIYGPGSFESGIWTFTTTGTGDYDGAFRCVDACGAACTTYAEVNVLYNSAPVCEPPGDTTIFLCASQEVCLPFDATDFDENLVGCEVIDGRGTIENGQWCYTPTEDEVITVTILCTDDCGATCESSFTVTFDLNEAPVCNLPNNASYDVCFDTTFSFTITAADPDNNLDSCYKVSGVGQFDGTTWTFTTSGDGEYCAMFECVDACTATCGGTVCITVDVNEVPECHVPQNQTRGMCEPGEVQYQAYGTDVDDNLSSCQIVSGPGQLVGNFWVYDVTGDETVTVTVRCTDACGAFCEKTFVIEFIIDEIYCIPPVIVIEKTHDTYQGHYEFVSITIEDLPLEMGGFDFLIAYDASALTFMEATPGQLLEDCGWEYFTYRYGWQGNCEGPCPSGLLRIIAIADLNNGPNHPSCFGPPDADPHELFEIKFYVTSDRTFECMYVPIKFFWIDCGDNAISNRAGDKLYVDLIIYAYEDLLLWNEDDDDEFPEDDRVQGVGAPDFCLNPDPEKPSAIRFIIFKFGGIDIICSDSIDAAGDLNMNDLPNEIADAVLYTNYFIYGLSVFNISAEGQIAASDVNKDGRVLTVGDLVYLIRVLTGDASAFGKLSPFANEVDVNIRSHSDRVELNTNSPTDIGAAHFVFNVDDPNADITVSLSEQLEGMDLISDVVDGQLKVLVYSLGASRIQSGENAILTIEYDGELELVSNELVDYYGNDLAVTVKDVTLPTEFAVSQNFPNPFNPETVISLSLPHSSDWTITIYNIAGQIVKTLGGYGEAGTVSVRWQGSDESGQEVASGIYLYKVSVGDYSVTKKMLLLK